MYKVIGADKIEYGPVDANQIRKWISEGRLVGESLVKPEGQPEFQAVRTVPEFAGMFGAVPPTPPVPPAPAPFATGMPGAYGAMNDPHTAALSAVKGPAIGIIVTAACGLLRSGLAMLPGFSDGFVRGLQSNRNLDPQMQQFQEMMMRFSQGPVLLISSLIGIALGIFLIYSAVKMMKLENYSLAFAASIVAVIPCLSPCCCIGIPFGIWGLVVLNRPWVKSQFR